MQLNTMIIESFSKWIVDETLIESGYSEKTLSWGKENECHQSPTLAPANEKKSKSPTLKLTRS